MKKYLLMAMAVLAALSLMVAGCGGKEEAKKAEPAKVLRVGTEPTFAPFEFQKEVAHAIVETLRKDGLVKITPVGNGHFIDFVEESSCSGNVCGM